MHEEGCLKVPRATLRPLLEGKDINATCDKKLSRFWKAYRKKYYIMSQCCKCVNTKYKLLVFIINI